MSARPLHILLVNNYTGRGGIPRAISLLANNMAGRGHRVTIISQRPVPRPLSPLYRLGHALNILSLPPGRRGPLPLGTQRLEQMYPLAPGIRVVPYAFSDKNLKVQRVRKQIRALDPDVCVCPLPDGSQLVWAVTLLGSGVPYVYSERTSPRAIEETFWNRKGRLAAMSGADAIHLLLPSYLESLPDFLRERARAIPNAVALPDRTATTDGEPGARKTLLWLGRLHEKLKQCRLALDAFALVAERFPDWDMHIAGDGQDAALVKAHARQLERTRGLAGRIRFLGELGDVWPTLASAQAFCFSSRLEGMPFALLEAQASGLPCAAFAGCPGVPDLIRHEHNGLLAQTMDAVSLARQLERLMADADLRRALGRNARLDAARFCESAVYDAWEELLREAAARKGATVMDGFAHEPFASMARMASRARQEWALRDFGEPLCDSVAGRIHETWRLAKLRVRQWL